MTIGIIENKMEINVGDYTARLSREECSFSNKSIAQYEEWEERISWIKNPRIRIYILIKMMKGDTFETAFNRVVDKVHLHDEDFRSLIN